MEIIAKKTESRMLITMELVIGMVIMAAAVVVLPIAIFSIDGSLIGNAFVWGLVLVMVAGFGSVGLFGFVLPYFRFRRLPEVQAETDGEFLYIHGRKEAKIPLSALEEASIYELIPYIQSWEFVIHLLSECYGTVVIRVPGYGKFKLHFIANARDVAVRLLTMAGQG